MPAATDTRARRRLEVDGVVQGVGFRPHVHRLATALGLSGFVRNEGGGVLIEVEGAPGDLDDFVALLRETAPEPALIRTLRTEGVTPGGGSGFVIAASEDRGSGAQVPPDLATCDECLGELFDPEDRRHRYPFINCTACGPRLTIVRGVPYDRVNTTMAGFEMCGECRREYETPGDRRFHAEPIACPACGPHLSMDLDDAVALLREGGILAVKGLGGYHLACDASSEAAVARLRLRKEREEKPLAVMTAAPGELVGWSEVEAELLFGRRRPIVLLRRRPGAEVAPSVAPGSPWLGVMLPYTPLHHLLCADFGGHLVMTSGNRSDEPIAFEDGDARRRLRDVADAFLSHDRPIHRRCEDSVVRASHPVRRSRGFAPEALPLPARAPIPILAAGAELKSTFCLARGDEAYLSPHLGDLDCEAAYRAFTADLDLYAEMLGVRPAAIAHDLHPDYLSTRWASRQEAELVGVQHHHAHAAACLAEHGRSDPALAVVLDGTGLGDDGTLWGAELLLCDLEGYERLAHLEPVPLPGGEAAIREPWRMAAAYLEAAGRPVAFERWPLVRRSLGVNAPLSSGAGRLFDAVAALLGVRETVSYEGQAAVELEHLAGDETAAPYACRIEGGRIRGADLAGAAYDDLSDGRGRREIAAAFHEGLAAAFASACAEAAGPRTVALSGGGLQNLRLASSLRRRLRGLGFEVLGHRLVPPNDGGISYGQAAVAARRMASCA